MNYSKARTKFVDQTKLDVKINEDYYEDSSVLITSPLRMLILVSFAVEETIDRTQQIQVLMY